VFVNQYPVCLREEGGELSRVDRVRHDKIVRTLGNPRRKLDAGTPPRPISPRSLYPPESVGEDHCGDPCVVIWDQSMNSWTVDRRSYKLVSHVNKQAIQKTFRVTKCHMSHLTEPQASPL